ncbi:PB1-F2 protein, partial [Influenza A virus (A/Connecticut/Flu007/2012(H3N2))]
PFNRQGWTN